MLNQINFRNYKGFKDGTLEIKPITILLGANSVGKSSIIQLFLLLQETALAENYNSPLKLHGGFLSLGEGINLFRNKDHSNSLELELSFNDKSLNSTVRNDFQRKFEEDLLSSCFLIFRSLELKKENSFLENLFNSDSKTNSFISNLNKKKKSLDRDDILSLINASHELIQKINNKEILNHLTANSILFRNPNIINSLIKNKEELIYTYDFLNSLKSINNLDKIKIKYSFSFENQELKIKSFRLLLDSALISNLDFENINNNTFISSDLFDFKKLKNNDVKEFRKFFKTKSTIFKFIDSISAYSPKDGTFFLYYIKLISEVITKVEKSFDSQKINYVSPLRAHPKRYYFLDKAKVNTFLDTLDGEAIAEILKTNSTLKNSVNSWFKKFNLHIDIGQIKDIIHQIVVKQNSLDLDITDVGFGVSQVLPVIIQGFLSQEKSLTLIEQPEIHLHPKMQADLADLFIDIVLLKNKQSENKYLIIETHSEYLLKRLRRRISENRISSENVGIYCVEHSDNDECAVIRKLEISKKGGFDWPKDFYTGELSDDVTEFLKNQM